MKRLLVVFILGSMLFKTASANYANDLEWLTIEGHPTYYGSTLLAHIKWDDIDNDKIIFADSFQKYHPQKTVLVMEAYKQENYEIIRDIEIYFKNCSPSMNLTIEEAIPIAASYFPYTIAENWYEHDMSVYVPAENSKYRNYYICCYTLTEDGKIAYKNGDHRYSGTITVIFYVNESGYVELLKYCFDTPREMFSSRAIEWDFDFFDYVDPSF